MQYVNIKQIVKEKRKWYINYLHEPSKGADLALLLFLSVSVRPQTVAPHCTLKGHYPYVSTRQP